LQRGGGAVKITAECDLDVAPSKNWDLEWRCKIAWTGGAIMTTTGKVFQPELIQLMKTVLDDATAMLPEAKRTSTMKAEIASQILACAAKGERDPIVLKNSALLAVVDCTHYSHDISPERRVV
jgi:hypothetical protein